MDAVSNAAIAARVKGGADDPSCRLLTLIASPAAGSGRREALLLALQHRPDRSGGVPHFLGRADLCQSSGQSDRLSGCTGRSGSDELNDARRLREEALELYAEFERKQTEVKDQAARIVEKAKADAELAAAQTKADIEASITRRLKAAKIRSPRPKLLLFGMCVKKRRISRLPLRVTFWPSKWMQSVTMRWCKRPLAKCKRACIDIKRNPLKNPALWPGFFIPIRDSC
jgi:hypothetical protein